MNLRKTRTLLVTLLVRDRLRQEGQPIHDNTIKEVEKELDNYELKYKMYRGLSRGLCLYLILEFLYFVIKNK